MRAENRFQQLLKAKAPKISAKKRAALERARERREHNAAVRRRAQELAAGTSRVLLAGVDTLTLSSRAELRPSLCAELLALKEAAVKSARDGGPPMKWMSESLGIEFEVKPNGTGKGPLLLSSEELDLVLHPSAPKNLPCAYVELGAQFLWRGWKVAADHACALLAEVAVADAQLDVQVSRLDVCCDFDGWAPTRDTLRAVVGRVLKRGEIKLPHGEALERAELEALIAHAMGEQKKNRVVKLHQVGQRFTGFEFGGKGAPLRARLYNKSIEIRSSGKEWFRPLWAKAGHKGDEHDGEVWRLEFQLRREPLTEAEVVTADKESIEMKSWTDVQRGLNELWGYLTGQWLSVRLPRTGRERVRLHPAWRSLCAARFDAAPVGTLVRHRNKLSLDRCTGALAGYLVRDYALHLKERRRSPDRERMEADLHALLKYALEHYKLKHDGKELYDAAADRWRQAQRFEAMFRPKTANA